MKNNVDVGSKAASIASYVLFGKVFTYAMLGIALVLVTRLIGPSQYGIYTLAVAFAGVFGSIGYFGVGTALNKFISEYNEVKDRKEINVMFSTGLFVVFVTGTILTLLCFALSNFISIYVFHSAAMSYIIEAISFWIISAMLFGTIYDSMLGFGNGRNITTVAAIQAFFQSSISIALALLHFGALAPILGLVLGYFLGFVVSIIIIFRADKLSFTMPSIESIKKLLGFSWPVATANIIGGAVGSFGLILLALLAVNTAIIGNIGVAARTGNLINVFFESISFAILPTFSATMANKKLIGQMGKIYGYTIYLAMLMVSPLLFYIAIFSVPFSYTLFGSQYTLAPVYISMLAMGILLGVAGSYANTLLVSLGKVKLALKYNLVVYGIVFVSFVSFIPLFGGMAYAAISFLLSPLVLSIIFVNRLQKYLKINFRVAKLIRIIAANLITSAILFPLSLFIGGIPLLVVAAVGFVVIYPLISVAIRGAEKEDIETLKAVSKGIPLVGKVLAFFADYANRAIS